MFARLFKQYISDECEQLKTRCATLENQVGVLEQQLRNLTITLQMSNQEIQDVVRKYRSNLWELKKIANELPPGHEKVIYERAFYSILGEKGAWIAVNSKFSSPPIFPHGYYGVFVSGGAVIGNNSVIFQQVTIGSNGLADSKGKGFPKIGNNVYFGAGAKIIGNVLIGDNVRIGANAIVTQDIPDNSVVVMEKPRVIHKENIDNRFFQIRNGKYGYYQDGEFIPIKK